MAWRARISRNVKELRVNLDPKADHSRGVRRFIDQHHTDIKTLNPKTPFVVQTTKGLPSPYFYVLTGFGAEQRVDLTNLTEHEVNDKLKQITLNAQFLPRNNFTLDGEFTPKDIDIIDYEMLKKNPSWQQNGIL